MANKASKFSNEPVTQEDLEAFMATQDDFALELYAYDLAIELQFDATHAGSYADRVTGKTRQFDVRASKRCGEDFHVYLAIECKCIRPSFPLLISQIPRHPQESSLNIIRGVGLAEARDGQVRYHDFRIADFKRKNTFYPIDQYVGKALVQVGKAENGGFVSNDAEVFDKWGQAIASANGLLRMAADLRPRNDMSQASIVLPVLVIPDGTLWVANYSDDGALNEGPVQQDQAQFYIGDKHKFDPEIMREFTMTHLHVVTKTGLKNLLEEFSGYNHRLSHLLRTIPA